MEQKKLDGKFIFVYDQILYWYKIFWNIEYLKWPRGTLEYNCFDETQCDLRWSFCKPNSPFPISQSVSHNIKYI